MGSIPRELTLDLIPTYVPKSIHEFLKEISSIADLSSGAQKMGDLIKRLEVELGKIQGFKRELPLCMLLLQDAIQFLKDESAQSVTDPIVQPVEFIPLKSDLDEDDDMVKGRDKMNWMSSVQLWKNPNQSQDYALGSKQIGSDDPFQTCKKRAFMPFKEDMPTPALSLLTPGTKTPPLEAEQIHLGSKSINKIARSNMAQANRKPRRCWSPELHRRFVNALRHLGGTQVATPKQIKEHMQVDGLTNDEVKSHLQKFRLHNRKNSSPADSSVDLGGMWMPQEHRHTSASSGKEIASPQGPLQLTANGERGTSGSTTMEDEGDEKSDSYSCKSRIEN